MLYDEIAKANKNGTWKCCQRCNSCELPYCVAEGLSGRGEYVIECEGEKTTVVSLNEVSKITKCSRAKVKIALDSNGILKSDRTYKVTFYDD